MKFSLPRNEFQQLLQTVVSAVPAKSTLPILSNLLITAADGKLTLVATDLDTSIRTTGDAKVGDKTLCLISKEEFVVTASSPKVDYEGKTYYFCCAGCDAKFKADPKKYLAK